MRNLKRVLSLAMAAAMLIGMMVISAGAASTYEDFTDKDEIQNTEAVNTMVSLGVINGKDDGSYFDPSGIVTRAEMAALIARCLNGGIDPSLGTGAATTTFTDTKGHWAEAYIAYCANLGIINGKGDGTFGPDEQVTGTAAAKMFLCALGYRSEIEGLTGAGWDLNTDSLANKTGLYDGLGSIRPSDGLNRDNTAQLVYNGVQANEVQYRNNYGEYSGVIYAQPNGTMLTNRFRVVKVEGVVEANDIFALNGTPAPAGKTRITTTDVYRNNAGAYITSTDDYTVKVSNDMVGTRVVIYVQFKNSLSPNAVGSVVVGEPISSEKNTIVETTGRLKDEPAVKAALRGSSISMADAGASTEITITEKDQATTTTKGIVDLPGVVQRFIDNDGDGTVEVLIREVPVLSRVSSYNTKDEKLTLTGVDTIDFDEIANYDEVEKDDYVLVAKYSDTYYLTVVEPVSGEVTAYNSGSHTITVDGTNYPASFGDDKSTLEDFALTTATKKHGNAAYTGTMGNMVSNTYNLYLDKGGAILAYEEVEATLGNYALVLNSGSNSDSLGVPEGKVKLLLSDGTTGTYNVDLLASARRCGHDGVSGDSAKESAMASSLAANAMQYQIVTYSLDGSTVTLTKPDVFRSARYGKAVNASSTTKLSSNTSQYVFGGDTLMADNSTIFFLRDGRGEFSVLVGLNKIPSGGLENNDAVANGKGLAIYDKPAASASYKTKTVKAMFMSVDENYVSAASYAYVSSDYSRSVVNGEDIYTYDVVFEDGTTGTLSSKSNNAVKKNVYSYKTDSKGYVTFEETEFTVNGTIVTKTGSGTVDLEDVNNEGSVIGSYPLSSSLKAHDVSDAPTVFDTELANRTISALVLDSSKNVRTAFVIETREGTMTADPSAISITATGTGTLNHAVSGASAKLGDRDVEFTGVVASDALKLNATFATGTTAKFTVTSSGLTGGATIVESGDLTSATDQTFFTAGSEGATDCTLTVKVTFEEPAANKKLARTITYMIDVESAAIEAPTVTLASGATHGIDVTGTSKDLSAAEATAVAATNWATGSKDTFKLTVTAAGASTLGSMTLKVGDAAASAYTGGSDVTIAAAGATTYILTVPVTETGKPAKTFTYEFTLTATAPLPTATAPKSVAVAGAQGTGAAAPTGTDGTITVGGSAIDYTGVKENNTFTVTVTAADTLSGTNTKQSIAVVIKDAGGKVVGGSATAADVNAGATTTATLTMAADATTKAAYTVVVTINETGCSESVLTYPGFSVDA